MTIQEFLKGDRFASLAGVELMEVASGYARTRMLIRPDHLNGGGICQGGALFTLADLAFAVVANSHAILTLSIDSTIHFFRPLREGYAYAEAREIFSHHRLASYEVRITDEAGDLVATFSATGYRKDRALPFAPVEAGEGNRAQ